MLHIATIAIHNMSACRLQTTLYQLLKGTGRLKGQDLVVPLVARRGVAELQDSRQYPL